MNKVLLVVNVFVVILLGFIVFKKLLPQTGAVTAAANYNTLCSYQLKDFKFHYEKESPNPTILMLGNSLIESANWNSVLHRDDVINRGIDGDNIQCIAKRMSYLQNCPAKICFIEAGIEDIRNTNIDTVLNYYKNIIQTCKDQHKIPVINFVLYIAPRAVKLWGNKQDYKAVNLSVLAFNVKLREYALLKGVDYIDMNPELTANNTLLEEYTSDGINLTPNAYAIWARKIMKLLLNHGI